MQEKGSNGMNQEPKRKYYALYAPYGIHVVYNKHHGPKVHIFETAKARDDWVSQDDLFNPKREAVKASEARRYLPKDRDDPHHRADRRSIIEDLKINRADVAARQQQGTTPIDRNDALR